MASGLAHEFSQPLFALEARLDHRLAQAGVTVNHLPPKPPCFGVANATRLSQVIVLTGFAETETIVTAMQGGAVTVLEKPCPMKTLLKEVTQSIAARQTLLQTRKTRAQGAARGRPPKDKALSPQLAAYETELIQRAIKRNNGDKSKAAKELGISRSQLYAKLKPTNA